MRNEINLIRQISVLFWKISIAYCNMDVLWKVKNVDLKLIKDFFRSGCDSHVDLSGHISTVSAPPDQWPNIKIPRFDFCLLLI